MDDGKVPRGLRKRDRHALREARDRLAGEKRSWPQGQRNTLEEGVRIWVDAIQLAGEKDITPAEALLSEVRRAAWRVQAVDLRITELQERGAPNAQVFRWMRESRDERRLLQRAAKMACDVGIANRIVRQLELEGELMARVFVNTIDRLGLHAEHREHALALLREELESARELDPSTVQTDGGDDLVP